MPIPSPLLSGSCARTMASTINLAFKLHSLPSSSNVPSSTSTQISLTTSSYAPSTNYQPLLSSAIPYSTRVSPTWRYNTLTPFSFKMTLFSSEQTAPFPPTISTLEWLLQSGIKATNVLSTCSPLPKVSLLIQTGEDGRHLKFSWLCWIQLRRPFESFLTVTVSARSSTSLPLAGSPLCLILSFAFSELSVEPVKSLPYRSPMFLIT